MRFCFLFALCAILYLSSATFAAGLKTSAGGINPEEAWNPKKSQHAEDLTLPMPCGGQMVFRAVGVPVQGVFSDKQIKMGVHDNPDPQREIYERTRDGYISGPFTLKEMPGKWRNALKQGNENFSYYFMGKYEVSVWQWQAVMEGMEGACPSKSPEDLVPPGMAKPKSDITWLEMQQFMYNYTQWLLKNHKDALPDYKDNKNIAFLRLPTEEEWEFAARGGDAVPEEHRNQENFHPLEDMVSKADFGIFTTAEQKPAEPAAIGTRHHNPLHIYDMAGNVKELVETPFQFSIPDMQAGGNIVIPRLHGSAGGFVTKGGSYADVENEILPGKREEIALFNAKGPVKTKELGFRMVLSGINTPESRRQALANAETILNDAKKDLLVAQNKPASPEQAKNPAADDSKVHINPSGRLSTELEKIHQATVSPVVRNNLEQYRRIVVDYENALDRRREEACLSGLRNLLFQIEGQRNAAARLMYSQEMLDRYEKGKEGESSQAIKQEARPQILQIKEDWKNILGNITNNYREELEKLIKVQGGQVHFDRLYAELGAGYQGKDMYSQHMIKNLGTLQNHIAQYRANGLRNLSKEAIWKDVITPAALKEILSTK